MRLLRRWGTSGSRRNGAPLSELETVIVSGSACSECSTDLNHRDLCSVVGRHGCGYPGPPAPAKLAVWFFVLLVFAIARSDSAA